MTEDASADDAKARHRKRVERRAKYLATLNPAQRRIRDNYIAWVRRWWKEYAKLVNEITNNKQFIRKQGHNNLMSLKLGQRRLTDQRWRARGMILARMAGKVDFIMMMEKHATPPPKPKAKKKAA